MHFLSSCTVRSAGVQSDMTIRDTTATANSIQDEVDSKSILCRVCRMMQMLTLIFTLLTDGWVEPSTEFTPRGMLSSGLVISPQQQGFWGTAILSRWGCVTLSWKEPGQQTFWNALETHQCKPALKISPQLFLFTVPCGKHILIKGRL